MKLGPKSRQMLEILLVLGLETTEAVMAASQIYRWNSYSSEKSLRQAAQNLDERGLIAKEVAPQGNWVAKLTEQGRALVNDDIDPERYWNEPWDGKWRLLAFDLPETARHERHAFNHWLERRRFGRLQGSVCVSPREIGDWMKIMRELNLDPRSVIYLTGRSAGLEQDLEYVAAAWPFDAINSRYREHLDFLKDHPPVSASPERFADWFQRESVLWRAAFALDPFLPRQLWTKELQASYPGPDAAKQRAAAYRVWRQLLGLS